MNRSATHDLTSGDHALISFELITRNHARDESQGTEIRYNCNRVNWTKFCKFLKDSRDKRIGDLECPDVEINTRAISAVLKEACDKHLRVKVGWQHRPPPWWNGTLAPSVAERPD